VCNPLRDLLSEGIFRYTIIVVDKSNKRFKADVKFYPDSSVMQLGF
jgi:hypothetical protein